MRIVKLHTITSTNDYLKSLVKEEQPDEDLLVWAQHQTQGRGQMGTVWHTEEGKNLTFSIMNIFLGHIHHGCPSNKKQKALNQFVPTL